MSVQSDKWIIKMAKENAIFGGELTGHYYFKDFFSVDSGIVPSLLLLEMLSRKGSRLSDLLAPLEKKYFISGEINSTVADPGEKIQALAERYAEGDIGQMDGISVNYDDWHFNVRASNTEPLLRLNLEAKNRELMEEEFPEKKFLQKLSIEKIGQMIIAKLYI